MAKRKSEPSDSNRTLRRVKSVMLWSKSAKYESQVRAMARLWWTLRWVEHGRPPGASCGSRSGPSGCGSNAARKRNGQVQETAKSRLSGSASILLNHPHNKGDELRNNNDKQDDSKDSEERRCVKKLEIAQKFLLPPRLGTAWDAKDASRPGFRTCKAQRPVHLHIEALLPCSRSPIAVHGQRWYVDGACSSHAQYPVRTMLNKG